MDTLIYDNILVSGAFITTAIAILQVAAWLSGDELVLINYLLT